MSEFSIRYHAGHLPENPNNLQMLGSYKTKKDALAQLASLRKAYTKGEYIFKLYKTCHREISEEG